MLFVLGEEFKQKWEISRSKNCIPGRKQYEKFNMTTYRQQESFTEMWSEGTFTPLDDYLQKEGFMLEQYPDQTSKLSLLEEPWMIWMASTRSNSHKLDMI